MSLRTFNDSINSALHNSLADDSQVHLLGLGITDPKAWFGTTKGLVEKFGPERIIECPTSENAYLGHAFGMSLAGKKAVVHFQRMDFMLYAYDQLVNNIAKWNDMFATDEKIHLVIRCLVGMGWGQGAQHSQNLTSQLLQVPNLTVVAPTCAASARSLFMQSLQLGKPVIFVEHRWLQYLKQNVSGAVDDFKIGKAKLRKSGNKVTVVTWSYSCAEALRFSELFPETDLEIIDLLTLSEIDYALIEASLRKTGRLLVWEPTTSASALAPQIGAELLSRNIKFSQACISYPFAHPGSAPQHAESYYWSLEKLVSFFNEKLSFSLKLRPGLKWPLDVDLQDWSPWL